ncbi:hypothetical protein XANCAGTX0491_007994 [Xanthoria calcicola]
MTVMTRIAELALIISTNTEQVDAHLARRGLPSPSFDPDSPAGTLRDSQIVAARLAILEATDELHALMLGPVELLTRQQPFNSWISLQAIVKFGLASSFPHGQDEASFADIAAASSLPEATVRRLLRHAMAFRIFQEPSEGIVRHTTASKTLADTPLLRQWMGMVSEELWPAATKTVEALTKWPGSEEPNHAGFNIAHDTDATIFDEISKYSDRHRRYADAMTFYSNGAGLEAHHILKGYDWSSLGESTVVDVGGSHGTLSIAIAQAFPSLRCVVQDRPHVVGLGQENLPSDLHDRVSFMAHDFFEEQPLRGAQIYTLRWILHDWPDKYAVRILQKLIPALKPGAKVLVLEQVLPLAGELSRYQEKAYRSMDLAMLATHNAKERDMKDWKQLFKMADLGYEITSVTTPKDSRLSIIEATWQSQRAY